MSAVDGPNTTVPFWPGLTPNADLNQVDASTRSGRRRPTITDPAVPTPTRSCSAGG